MTVSTPKPSKPVRERKPHWNTIDLGEEFERKMGKERAVCPKCDWKRYVHKERVAQVEKFHMTTKHPLPKPATFTDKELFEIRRLCHAEVLDFEEREGLRAEPPEYFEILDNIVEKCAKALGEI